ncbi:metal-sulfur cluster assembly factor [Sphingobacterium sp. PU5-4]|uniref:Metal-sulfur cluster assembly factor n=1 Tax=Sphingobacterium tenebrionis TaxID=3111775 RepID=A0ABU8I0X6_9SPHI
MQIKLSDPYAAEKIKALQALPQVIDPELGINIIDMGLVYDLDFSKPTKIKVEMTLSTPNCPMGDAIMQGVENRLLTAFPERGIEIELVWEPVWSIDMMSDEGRAQLNM